MLRTLLLKRGYRLGRALIPALPASPRNWLIARLLNQHLAQTLADGDFDFLEGRCLAVYVIDFSLTQKISLHAGRFVSATGAASSDVTIAANSADLLALLNGNEDPDTLFFQRRLQISGDTELGLTAKNRLDAFDKQQLPAWMRRSINLAARALAEASAA